MQRQIFRSEETTITDEDIDILVDRGIKKTEEMNQKLRKYVKRSERAGFSLDSTNYQILDGVDYSDVTLAKRVGFGKRHARCHCVSLEETAPFAVTKTSGFGMSRST